MKKMIVMALILSGCTATLQSPFSDHVTKAEYAAGEEQRVSQLKQLAANIAVALDKKVDKPEVKVSK